MSEKRYVSYQTSMEDFVESLNMKNKTHTHTHTHTQKKKKKEAKRDLFETFKRITLFDIKTEKTMILFKYISLTNPVRGPYCRLGAEFIPHGFIAQARSAQATN